MWYGWTGRVLKVDLGSRRFEIIEPGREVYEKDIGGKGLAGHFLLESGAQSLDDPAMPVLMFTGPLVGTRAPTSGRMTLMSRSPLTGTVGDASVGGGLGVQIKRAGYDGLIITGVASSWLGLEIEDDAVRFVPASKLTGLDLHTAAESFTGSGSVAMVGPAAESGVLFSSVMVDRHFAAARNGLGLSFGAKRLKYVRVTGSGDVPVKDSAELDLAREEVFRLVAASPILMGVNGIRNLGTPALYDLMHSRRMMPTDNFARTFFEHAPGLNAGALARACAPKRMGCKGCHILCKKMGSGGRELPEFETLSHFTALVGNRDLSEAVRANEICNDMGMDTVSAAATLACHREIEGIEYGPGQIVGLLEKIGRGEGIGLELGLGSARYARERGLPGLSMSVKGQELPAYDPRGAYGMALAYATSTRGGCHLRAYPIGHEILRKPVATDRFTFSGKARIIKISEDKNALIDSLTACKFVFFASSLEEYARAYTAVTGVETTATDLSWAGERIYYRERIMNAGWGFDSSHDDLPERFFTESGSPGPGFDVPPISRRDFLDARRRYYRIRGLDERGMPNEEKARTLGIQWKS